MACFSRFCHPHVPVPHEGLGDRKGASVDRERDGFPFPMRG